MNSKWIAFLIEVTSGGADASWFTRLVRICLTVCTIIAVAQLVTMWSTRWGDRHLPVKAFSLSLLLHVCICLTWVAAIDSNSKVGAGLATQEAANIPVMVVEDVIGGQSGGSPNSSGSSGPFEASASISRSSRSHGNRQARQSVESPVVEAPQQADNDQFQPDVRDLPSVGSPAEVAVTPQELASPEHRLASLPAPVNGVEDVQLEARKVSSEPARTRRVRSDASFQDPLPVARPVDAIKGPSPALPALPDPVPQSVPLANDVAPGVPSVRVNRSSKPFTPAPVEAVRMEKGIVRGVVTDARTGRPLAKSIIRFDRGDGKSLTAVTRADGTYELVLPETPDAFVITASQADYLPDARNLRSKDVSGKTSRVDFSLRTGWDREIAVENNPVVHHLGNDQFEGTANSKFQKRSEGATFVTRFTLNADQVRAAQKESAITFLAKGLQCPLKLQINNREVATEKGLSPADGGFGPLVFPFSSSWLKVGENEITMNSSNCQGDLDDFEFVNVQIRLSKPN